MRTFTKDTARSEQGMGAAWHVWFNARHGRGTTWARHGNDMLCVNRPLVCSNKLFVSLCIVRMGASNSAYWTLPKFCFAARLFGASSSGKIAFNLIRNITCDYGIGHCTRDHFYQQYNIARNKLWKPCEQLSVLVFTEKYQLWNADLIDRLSIWEKRWAM